MQRVALHDVVRAIFAYWSENGTESYRNVTESVFLGIALRCGMPLGFAHRKPDRHQQGEPAHA